MGRQRMGFTVVDERMGGQRMAVGGTDERMGYAVADERMVMNGLLSERMERLLGRTFASSVVHLLLCVLRVSVVFSSELRFWIVKRGGVC